MKRTIPPGQGQRTDAARNRERIVAAARKLFAAEGFDVSMDAVAVKAGVGRATLYRNFEDKHQLSWAIFDDNLRALEKAAEGEKGRAGAFVRLLTLALEESLDTYGLIPALAARRTSPLLEDLAQRMVRLLRAPFREAQRRGEVRKDLRAAQVLEILGMVFSSALTATNDRDRRLGAKRALDLVLNGVRPR